MDFSERPNVKAPEGFFYPFGAFLALPFLYQKVCHSGRGNEV
jgi:hypothetical protein